MPVHSNTCLRKKIVRRRTRNLRRNPTTAWTGPHPDHFQSYRAWAAGHPQRWAAPFTETMRSKRSDLVRCLLFILWLSASAITGLSQNPDGVIELRSAGCEVDEANFNVVRVDALERMGDNGLLIAVARLGRGDKSRYLNHSRLSATKEWLSNATFPTERLVLAEGERLSGGGRVEFYIGGRLTHVILPKPNIGLCTECCNPRPEDFTSNRRRKRRR
jgi:hypothetical protein